MEVVVVIFGPANERDTGVVKENQLDWGERTEQLDQSGSDIFVVCRVSPESLASIMLGCGYWNAPRSGAPLNLP